MNHLPFYHSCHKLALIASISSPNTQDLRVCFLFFFNIQHILLTECCLQTRRFWRWWLYASDNTVMDNDVQHGVQISITDTHTHSRLPLWRLPCLPLVSFLLSLFIWIKIRLRPDILLIGVVSCWRTTDLDGISHPVKSDSRQCTND